MAAPKVKTSKIRIVHCNHCRRDTNHTILKSTGIRSRSEGSNEEYDFWSTTKYQMLQCRGCEEVVLRREYLFSEDPEATISFFPPPAARWLPEWAWTLPPSMDSLLKEIYTALQADSLTLAMMGARAVIEAAIIAKVEDHGTFKDNLQALEDAGHLSKTNREHLEVALDAGSASAHRAHRPNNDQMNTVMDIVENLLNSLFALEDATKALKAAIPPRPPKKKKSKPITVQ